MLLDGTLGYPEALGDLGTGEAFDPVKLENLLRSPRQLRHRCLQDGEPLASFEDPVDRHRRVGQSGELIQRQGVRLAPLLPPEVIDDEVAGRAIEVSTRVRQPQFDTLLGHAREGFLQQVGGGVPALDLPGKVRLKLSPMC